MKSTLILAACLSMVSCSDSQRPVERAPEIDSVMKLSEELERSHSVAFASWNGKLCGNDSDMILHFRGDASIVLEVRSISVGTYEGTYRIDSSGTVAVDLPNYRERWPSMKIRTEGETLLLERTDGHTSWLEPGFPGLADAPADFDGFWPFREMGE